MNDFILCGVKDCSYSSTHTLFDYGFCCKHFEEFTHAFTHKEFEKFASKFDWNIKLYEKAISELKSQIREEREEHGRQYSNLAEVCNKALLQIKNDKPKTKRRKRAKA